jgi:hypothetical protein
MRLVAERVRALDPHRTMDDVVARLLEIERERNGYRNPAARRRRLRRRPDGVACFNYMYLRVTEEVRRSLGRGEVRGTLESGLLRLLDRLCGRLDDLFASFVVARARDDAWARGARWRRAFDEESAAAHERHVGYESHLILAA